MWYLKTIKLSVKRNEYKNGAAEDMCRALEIKPELQSQLTGSFKN